MLKVFKKYFYFYLICFASISASIVNTETGWTYNQTTAQAFYLFHIDTNSENNSGIYIDDIIAVGGEGESQTETDYLCGQEGFDCDVIGAFIERDEVEDGIDYNSDEVFDDSVEICVGWAYMSNINDVATIPMVGADSYFGPGYLADGEIPYLKIYDASNQSILALDPSNIYYEENFDDCGYDNICPGDEEYIAPDEDGSESNGVHDPDIPAETFTDCIPGNLSICDGDDGFMPWHDNDSYDEGEPFDDANQNGVWDDEIIEEFEADYDWNRNGEWDSYVSSELLGFYDLSLYLFQGTIDAYNTFGCTDIDACDYDSDATADDGSCSFHPSGDIPITFDVSGNSIELTWDEPPVGTSDFYYEVTLSLSGDELTSVENAVSPLVFNDLYWSSSYDISITANNICGSTTTDISGIEVGDMPAPDAVTLDTPQGSEGLIFLSWSDSEFASMYRIFSNDELIDSTSNTMYSHSSLAPGITNSYKIQGVNIEGTSGMFSNEELGSTEDLGWASLDTLTPGQGYLMLHWEMEEGDFDYGDVDYVFQIEMNECGFDDIDTNNECSEQYEVVEEDYGSIHYENNLDANMLYCFRVTPFVTLDTNNGLEAFYSNTTESQCGTPEEVSGWMVIMQAQIHGGWTADQTAEDLNNYLGMSPQASDGFDLGVDIFEPPLGGADFWISLSFPHPEWGATIGDLEWDLFATDIRELKDLSRRLEVWDLRLQFPPPGGNVSLDFDFVSDAGGYPVFLKHNDDYQKISDQHIVSFGVQSLESGANNDFNIIIGNQPPLAPQLTSIEMQNSRSITIGWTGDDSCTVGELCNDYSSRYPATSYKIYRQWAEELIPHVVGLSGTPNHKIAIFPHDLFVASDEEFELVQQPENGIFEIEYFEPCITSDHIDCGWDGLCDGDEGYEQADLGEGDGICNQIYYYTANGAGLDSLSYANGVYDPEEEFSDDNGNGQWDIGEEYIDNRELKISISDDLQTTYLDYDLRTATSYTYNISASNIAGDSDVSNALSTSSGPNQDPIANAGVDQSRYILSGDLNTIDCTFPLSVVGVQENSCDEFGDDCTYIYENINLSYDPDGLAGEILEYEWEIHDPGNYLGYDDLTPLELSEMQISPVVGSADWWLFSRDSIATLILTLPDEEELGVDEDGENIVSYDYSARLKVTDASNYPSFYNFMTVTITRDVPEPAEVENFEGDEDLYYIDFSWDRSSYDSWDSAEGTNFPSDPNYNGIPDLAEYYVVYRDSFYIDYSIGSDIDCENEDGQWMLGGDYHPDEYCRKTTYVPIVTLNDETDVEYTCISFSAETIYFDTLNECLTSSLCANNDCREFFKYSDSWEEDYLIGEEYVDVNQNGRWDALNCEIDETTCNLIKEDNNLSDEQVAFEDCVCAFDEQACDAIGGYFEVGDCVLSDSVCTLLGGEFSAREEYIDDNLNDIRDSNESHCYFVVAFNGTGASEPCGYNSDGEPNYEDCLPEDQFISPSNLQCFETGSLPIPIMTSPCGGEIMASGSEQVIDWDFAESNVQYIQEVRIYQSQDSGNSWSMIEDGAPPQVSYEFTVMETDTISFYNKFKVEVVDVGNQIHQDKTDYLIIIASDELQNDYPQGYNIISSPLLLDNLDFSGGYLLYEAVESGVAPLENEANFENGEGYYLLSSTANTNLEIEGEILSDGIIDLSPGWNLIGNPLVAKFPIEWLEIISMDGDVLSWFNAASQNKVMPYIFGFDNDSREHELVDIIDPFYGYWVYASENLQLSFEPRVYDESLYENDRNSYWELTLHASVNNPVSEYFSIGDHVKVGLNDNANNLFEYGVDGYDLEGPEDLGAPNFINLYIDNSDWEGVESNKFYSDIRSTSALNSNVPVSWSLIGEEQGQTGGDILITWDIENEGVSSIDDKDLFFQYIDSEFRCICPDEDQDGEADECDYDYVDELCDSSEENSCGGNQNDCVAFSIVETVDMKIESLAIIPGLAFDNAMQITIVAQDDSCEGQGLEQCADGTCGDEELGGVCTCEQNLSLTCGDGTCSTESEVDGCSCEQNLDVTCPDSSCASESAVDGCSCEQNLDGITCGDGSCSTESEVDGCSCEQNSEITCADGSCASQINGCSCEQSFNGITCGDGTCSTESEVDGCSCEQNLDVTCPDSSCASESEVDGCSCEQNLDGITCGDGTCSTESEVDGCSCEQDQLGDTCVDETCGELEDGSCSCEQDLLFDCYGDGVCYELTEDINGDFSINLEDCPCVGDECEEENSNDSLPMNFSLSAPYPNPFNPSVKVDFSLPTMDNIDINIYDINGEHIENIMSGFKSAGFYTAYWNASSNPTGIYFINFSSSSVNKTMKVVLVK